MRYKGILFLLLTILNLVACSEDASLSNTTGATDAELQDIVIASSITDALASKQSSHEESSDYTLAEDDVIEVKLNGNSIDVSPAAGLISGTTFTITSAGTYRLSGELSNGNIIVNTADEDVVRLILNGVNIKASATAPLYAAAAGKVVLILPQNTVNQLEDGSSYVYASSGVDEPSAALYSAADLTIYGQGELIVKGNYNDAVNSKDGLLIRDATVTAISKDDGLRGKDYAIMANAKIEVTAGGDGIKSDNDEDTSRGYILVQDGNYKVISAGDALNAATDLLIEAGDFNLKSGGGSSATTSISAKSLKSAVNLIVEAGSFEISAADDALHSANNLAVNGGTFLIATGDDGIHSDATLGINGGNITITESYEGLEAPVIQMTSGTVHLTASDDGLNVSGETAGGTGGAWGGGQSASNDQFFDMQGGNLYIDARGDGVDVNGSVQMTNGVIVVNGPTENMNGPLDYDGSFTITGGLVLAVGSSGMAQAPGGASTQNSLLINFTSTQPAGSLIHLESSDGTSLFTFQPERKFQSLAYSSAALAKGSSFNLYLGGSSAGTNTDGFYDGTYSAGTLVNSFTVTSVTTKINAR